MSAVTIFLVEDDDVDVMAFQRALRELKIANPLVRARDGLEALEMLRGENGRTPLSHPYLILLDLNMPRMNGFEFLEELRKNPALHSSLVFVLTTSSAEEDRVRAYGHNVAGYVLKHAPGRSFLDAVSTLNHYWKILEFPE